MKNIAIVAILLICVCHLSYAQTPIIITIAGNGVMAHSGDGGPATAASIIEPSGICVSPLGYIYFCELGDDRIRKISGGIISGFAGGGAFGLGDGGPATAASLHGPYGLFMDDTGNILVADDGHSHVRKINTSGIISSLTAYGLIGPFDVTTDYHHFVLIADRPGPYVRRIDATGSADIIAGNGVAGYAGDGGPATAGELFYPCSICIDKAGNIYVSDEGSNRIRKVDTFGIITTIAGAGPSGVGAGSFAGDGGPATAAYLNGPVGIRCDTAGNIYFCDAGNNRIRKINSAGIITTIAGNGTAGYSGDDCGATAAELNNPLYLTLDNSGNIYFTDELNNRVREIVMNHQISFARGHLQSLDVCVSSPAVAINSLLAVTDADAGQTVNWSILMSPAHGSLAATYTATSTGSIMTPTGLSYTPASGYTGTDVFKVVVVDCAGATDTTTINVTIVNPPAAGTIIGADTVCVGAAIALTDTSAGGMWNSSNANASVSGGMVTGHAPGTDTIRYIVSNACGADTASLQIDVNGCITLLSEVAEGDVIKLFPNPSDGTFSVLISSAGDEQADVTVTDAIGKKVGGNKVATNKESLFRLKEPAGVYILQATTSSGKCRAKVTIR